MAIPRVVGRGEGHVGEKRRGVARRLLEEIHRRIGIQLGRKLRPDERSPVFVISRRVVVHQARRDVSAVFVPVHAAEIDVLALGKARLKEAKSECHLPVWNVR